MTRATHTAIALFLVITAGVLVGAAQSTFDRRVGRFPEGRPITFTVQSSELFAMAVSAGIQIGIEGPYLPVGYDPWSLKQLPVTGLTVGEALRHYATGIQMEWRDVKGVAVGRPRASWNADAHPLHLPAPEVHVQAVTTRQALALVCALLGAPEHVSPRMEDYGSFGIDFAGGTVLELLTEIVRAGGATGWEARFVARDHARDARMVVSLHSYVQTKAGFEGGHGECAVPGRSPGRAVNPDAFFNSRAPASVSDAMLDRIVGLASTGHPIEMIGYRGPGPLGDLARTTGVPFGSESWPPNDPSPSWGSRSAVLTGKTLREALDTIVDLDPRFAWRNMGGVIVMRPVSAWNDSRHQLSQAFRGFSGTVPTGEAVAQLAAHLGSELQFGVPYQDDTVLSLDLPAGRTIDFVNGIARARGDMSWHFTKAFCCSDPPNQGPAGEQYMLTIGSGGTARSFWVK